MRIIINTLLLLVLMTTFGCGPQIVPIAVKGAVIDERRGAITIEKEGIKVTAEATLLHRTPYDLESYYTPFRVVIRNETGDNITVGYDNFVLFDGNGNQYRPDSPDEIAKIIKSDPEYVVKPPTVAVPVTDFRNYSTPYPSPYQYPYTYNPNQSPYYDPGIGQVVYPPTLDVRDMRKLTGETLMQDIYLTSLPVGDIIDGAQVSGNVYFRADMRGIKNAKIRVTVNETVFELPFIVK